MRRSGWILGLGMSLCTAAVVHGQRPNGGERLEKAVRHELVMLQYDGRFDNLAFQIDGARIILLGQVTRPTLRSDAERVIRGVEGVQTIDNKIEVLPLSPNDDRIRLALYRAIYSH